MEYARVTEIIRYVLGLDEGLVDWIRRTERAGVDTKNNLQISAKKGTRIHDYVSKVIEGKKTRIQKQYKERVTILLDYFKDKKEIKTEVALKYDLPVKHQGHLDYLYIDNENYVVADLKTGKPRKEHELQLQGYGYLSEKNGNFPDRLELLYLKPDCLDIVVVKYCPELWEALLKLYEWKYKT